MLGFNLNAMDAINQRTGCLMYVQAGDSIEMEGIGFYGTCSLTIDDIGIMGVETEGNNKMRFRIPKGLFGNLNNSCNEELKPFKVTNGDGKTLEKSFHIATSPPMYIDDATFDKTIYSAGAGSAFLTIHGYSLYSSAMIRLSGPNDYEAISALAVTGYQNDVVVPFLLGGLGPGTYNVQVKQNVDSDYGFPIASFVIN